MFYSFWQAFIRLFLTLAFRMKVRGLENVPARGAVIFCSNHASFLDPLCVGAAARNRQSWYMARDTLFRNPLFARVLKSVRAFPVKRGSADRAAWQHFEDLSRAGEAILFFPEGTRSPDGSLQPARAGSGMLVHRCPGATLVPVRIFGSEKALPRGSALPRPAAIQVVFGPPLDVGEELALPPEKSTYELIAAKIMRAIEQIRPLD